ncbi:21292_t:CDS:2 [Racocetra persica]|uniref:21292_t:CDS:1 n=1 Tax=Racocetra persica TaxID=160502 RepID=A0ACA9SDX4_9GLOM|nr:21292_t:CDS:2 [Racocetra persica]
MGTFSSHLYLALLLSYDMSTFKDLIIFLLHDYKTTTNYQDQNNNKTPHDIPNSKRRCDMACLKFLSSSTNLGLILWACALWSSIMPILGLSHVLVL